MVINKKQMVNTPCTQCGENIHPKRLEILPNIRTCVKCSNTGRKKLLASKTHAHFHEFWKVYLQQSTGICLDSSQ